MHPAWQFEQSQPHAPTPFFLSLTSFLIIKKTIATKTIKTIIVPKLAFKKLNIKETFFNYLVMGTFAFAAAFDFIVSVLLSYLFFLKSIYSKKIRTITAKIRPIPFASPAKRQPN